MISGFHQRLRNMTIRQLGLQPRGKGSETTLVRTTDRIFVPSTGKYIGGDRLTFVGSAVRVNYKENSYRDVAIVYGDFQLYLSPVLLNGDEHPEPEIGDVISFLGKDVHVINISPFNDNGIGCGWKLQVRYG